MGTVHNHRPSAITLPAIDSRDEAVRLMPGLNRAIPDDYLAAVMGRPGCAHLFGPRAKGGWLELVSDTTEDVPVPMRGIEVSAESLREPGTGVMQAKPIPLENDIPLPPEDKEEPSGRPSRRRL